MPFYTDQLGRVIELHCSPKRIISLVPSQTELLYDLGLEEEVIGITKFCIHPEKWFRNKTRIGGTKTLHLQKIKDLQPDFILANKEENVKEQIEELATYFPVWISDVTHLDNALQMIAAVGIITGKENEAQTLVSGIVTNFCNFSAKDNSSKLTTAYLIWQRPYITVGGDTFIHHMLQVAGFENVFSGRIRYPEITLSELQALHCNILLLSSEPYPFTEMHIQELQPLFPNTVLHLADGELFSWYGSRLLHAPAYFLQLKNEIQQRMEK